MKWMSDWCIIGPMALWWMLLGTAWVVGAKIDEEPATSVHDVESVLGKVAKLPCDIDPTVVNDRIHIVIWFKEVKNRSDPNAKERRVPIFSLDARDRAIGQAEEWKDEKILGQRATFRLKDRPAILLISSVKEDDGAVYYCRVDFKQTPTRNIKVNLSVIIPTEKLKIIEGSNDNHIKDYKLGPFNEGSSVNITCEATGGRPLPKVTWWLENALLDESMEYVTSGSDDPDEPTRKITKVRNVLHVENVDRKTLNSVFTCQATNSRLVHPISSTITLDVNLKPLSVKLLTPYKPLSAGHLYELECQVIGARPEPSITWWKGSTQMKNTRETTGPDGNMTTSTLTFVPSVDDGGKYLSCRGEQPRIQDSGLEDGWKLDIYHVPLVSLELGSTLNGSTIKEGVDVYFECNIKSNPWVFKVSWRHNGKPLYNNQMAGTIVSNQSLVLQSITTARSGHYTCVGHNQEGDGESNSVYLDVKYVPVCKLGQTKIFGVARHELTRIICDVEANPTEVEFTWKFNNTADAFDIPPEQIHSEKTRSTARFVPMSERDYGTLLCWGENEIGRQKEPCVYFITPAGKPDSLSNCSISNQTTDSIIIDCYEGYDGGLPQTFVIEVFESSQKRFVKNMSSSEPMFVVTGLESGADFDIGVYAVNSKGRSPVLHLSASTLKGAEKHTAKLAMVAKPKPPENCTVTQQLARVVKLSCKTTQTIKGAMYLMQVYDANTRILIGTTTSEDPKDLSFTELPLGHNDLMLFVRTIGANSLASDASIIYVPAHRMVQNRAATPVLLQITPLLGALIGVVAALILVAIIIVVVIRLRGGGDRDDKDYDDGGLSSSGRRCVAGSNSDKASTEPLNKDMNDSVDSLEEKNPDIIPQNNADDEYQDEERAFERLNNAPSVRVYSRLQSPNNQTKNGCGYASKNMNQTGELTYAELSISTQQMPPHVVYSPHPPSIALNMVRRPEPTVYAQLDMKRIPQGMPHPGGFQTLHHPHLPAYMTRQIRDDQLLHDGSISSETPLLGTGSALSSLKDMTGTSRTPSVTSTLPRPVTATRF